MKTWIKRTLMAALGAGVLLGGLAACSHRMEGFGHERGWSMREGDGDGAKMRERLIAKAGSELALDEAQKAKLGVLADALQAQRAALMAGTTHPRAEMQALVAGAQFDRSKAQALIDSKLAAVRDKSPTVVAAAGDFYDSLKPEQQTKLRGYMTRGKGRHHD